MKSSFKFFPVSQFGQKIPPPRGPEYISLNLVSARILGLAIKTNLFENLFLAKMLTPLFGDAFAFVAQECKDAENATWVTDGPKEDRDGLSCLGT